MSTQYYGKAESAAGRILELFRSGNVPEALAPIFIRRNDNVPCRAWSWSNQLLVALAGYDDARGYRQWESVGRHVRKGERAFYILAPCTRKIVEHDDETGEESERVVVYGFRAVPVFGYEQTDGKPLPDRVESERFIDGLPLVSVARAWGLHVTTYGGAERVGAAGYYRPGQSIALGVENLATWAHELVHAADDRLGELAKGAELDREVVGELGGATLLRCLGHERESDVGGCWRYVERYAKANKRNTLSVCEALLQRTCEAVALILNTADKLSAAESEAAA